MRSVHFLALAFFSALPLAASLSQTPGNGSSGNGPGFNGDAPASDNSGAAKASRDAIPLTPEMIEDLAKRYRAQQQAIEQGATEVATPINRQVNVSFAPGAATSIINTIKGYPTAVSFFDSTGQPWPIQWDTNSNPAAIAGGTNCNAATNGGPSVAEIGFYVCTPTKGSNVLEITPVSVSREADWWYLWRARSADHLSSGLRRRAF